MVEELQALGEETDELHDVEDCGRPGSPSGTGGHRILAYGAAS